MGKGSLTEPRERILLALQAEKRIGRARTNSVIIKAVRDWAYQRDDGDIFEGGKDVPERDKAAERIYYLVGCFRDYETKRVALRIVKANADPSRPYARSASDDLVRLEDRQQREQRAQLRRKVFWVNGLEIVPPTCWTPC
jgi:hypothetical protein